MNFKTQTIREEMAAGATYGEARNVFNQEYRKAKYLARKAYELASRIERGAAPAILPIVLTDGNTVEPIGILDCPRNWTSDRVASFREEGRYIVRQMMRDARLFKLVTTYLRGTPDNAKRGEFYRLRSEYCTGGIK